MAAASRKAKELVQALRTCLESRHSNDIFCTEALTGPGGSNRFDGWAMEPSWVRTRCSGYEIKISRSDFTGDKKWRHYLDYCTEFYFVCPSGLIKPEELPHEVGLLWSSSTGSRLYQKKAAIPHEIGAEELSIMLRHVLMWRYGNKQPDKRDTVKQWIADLDSRRELNYALKNKIKKAAGAYAEEVRQENIKLKDENQILQAAREWLDENEIDYADSSSWRIARELEEHVRLRREGITKKMDDLQPTMRRLGESLLELAEDIKKPDGK